MHPSTPDTQTAAGAPFTVSRGRRVLDLDAMDDVAGVVRVYGREVTVHHLDGAAYRAIRELQETGSPDIQALYDAVGRCCPELSQDEVDRLTGPKLGAILAVAEKTIKDVEAALPNAPRPTETTNQTSSPPASSPGTPSAM